MSKTSNMYGADNVNLPFDHYQIHEAEQYIYSGIVNVASLATIDVVMVTGAKEPHLTFAIQTDLLGDITIKEGVTVGALGATSTALNLHRDSSKMPDSVFYNSATSATGATTLYTKHTFGISDRFVNRVGTVQQNSEWNFKANEKYMLRFVNEQSTAGTLDFTAQFYEVAD